MANIALNFEDGVTRIIEGLPGETVAESAYRLGINIPLDCADGACGTCKCMCLAGEYDPGDYIEDALSDDEASEGFGLACQIRPETDMVINILASSAACKVKAESFPVTITDMAFLGDETIKLTVNINDDKALSFLPGQYVNIEIPGTGITRSYSFSNLSKSSQLTFLIRIVADGAMSNYLTQEAKVGDTLQLTGPLGSFYLRSLQQPSLFFAGGTGIAPFISMLEELSLAQVQHPVHLFYGARNEKNLVELERLEYFKSKMPLTIYTCVSGETCEKHPSGHVNQWINKDHLNLANYDVYICGPTAMVDSVKDSLATEAINFSNFYMEKFIPSGSVLTV
jgi:benzoate/toluate 1,2-dioxygenase reductase subunit